MTKKIIWTPPTPLMPAKINDYKVVYFLTSHPCLSSGSAPSPISISILPILDIILSGNKILAGL